MAASLRPEVFGFPTRYELDVSFENNVRTVDYNLAADDIKSTGIGLFVALSIGWNHITGAFLLRLSMVFVTKTVRNAFLILGAAYEEIKNANEFIPTVGTYIHNMHHAYPEYATIPVFVAYEMDSSMMAMMANIEKVPLQEGMPKNVFMMPRWTAYPRTHDPQTSAKGEYHFRNEDKIEAINLFARIIRGDLIHLNQRRFVASTKRIKPGQIHYGERMRAFKFLMSQFISFSTTVTGDTICRDESPNDDIIHLVIYGCYVMIKNEHAIRDVIKANEDEFFHQVLCVDDCRSTPQ